MAREESDRVSDISAPESIRHRRQHPAPSLQIQCGVTLIAPLYPLGILSELAVRDRAPGAGGGKDGGKFQFFLSETIVLEPSQNVFWQRSIPGEEEVNWRDPSLSTRAVREYIEALDEETMRRMPGNDNLLVTDTRR